jgi:hypothetical protein
VRRGWARFELERQRMKWKGGVSAIMLLFRAVGSYVLLLALAVLLSVLLLALAVLLLVVLVVLVVVLVPLIDWAYRVSAAIEYAC